MLAMVGTVSREWVAAMHVQAVYKAACRLDASFALCFQAVPLLCGSFMCCLRNMHPYLSPLVIVPCRAPYEECGLAAVGTVSCLAERWQER